MEYGIVHLPEDKLKEYETDKNEDHRKDSYAWGVFADDKLIAAIETYHEFSSNRLKISELWVAEKYQRQGIGHALIGMAKEQLRRERCRAVILEIKFCNADAAGFCQHEGFSLISTDTCNKEFGWFPEEKKRLNREDIEIRMETKEDWYDVELMTQHAFWNKHHLGCDEHYLVHKLRQDKNYLPELSRIAVKDGQVIGCIMYSKARVVDGTNTHEIITFGPLCVEPKWQGCGVGEYLLRETMKLAADKGFRGIVIFGEPEYYPRIGFKTCDHFNITTADGKNFDAFMGIELAEGSMKSIKGKFYEAEVFENLPKEEVEEYNKKFPRLQKLRFPGQWD